jgi:asparagine synthase (glutamine-hydrolysing)
MRISEPVIDTETQQLELTEHSYWDIDFNPDHKKTEEQWVEGIRAKLEESVRLRLISDVPIGAFLSGGIDSSAVVATMASITSTPPKTFTIGFDVQSYNEIQYARKIAEKYQTDHLEFTVAPNAIEALQKLAWAFDEPFADSSAVPTYYVSKIAREHVTVILSGDGGDEACAGYDRYQVAKHLQHIDRIPLLIRRIIFGGIAALLPLGIRGKGFLNHLSQDTFSRSNGVRTFDGSGYIEHILHTDFFQEIHNNQPDNGQRYGFLRKFYDRYQDLPEVSRLQYVDMKTYLAEDIMAKVDRASMLCSLETRAPLLDHKFLEYVARIPANLQLKDGQKKYMLKQSMAPMLPNDILYRPKKGFEVPLNQWFKTDLADYTKSILLSDTCAHRGLLNRRHIEKILNAHQKKYLNLSSQIWSLLFFEQWCREWLDS